MESTVLIGRDIGTSSQPFGFTQEKLQNSPVKAPTDILDREDGGLVTIAATGAGKGVSQVIPNALTYPGSMIIIDIKGEIAAVTARRRREMGQKVYVINPFDPRGNDYINPFDMIHRGLPDSVDECRMIADLLITKSHQMDPFWDDRARDLITGATLFLSEHLDKKDQALHLIHRLWSSDTEELVKILSCMRESPAHDGLLKRFAHQYIDAPDKTRGSIQSTLMGHLMPLASRSGHRAFSKAGRGRPVDLRALAEGAPMTIYLTVPPHYLATHAAFLRIWVGALLSALKMRKQAPLHKTLFVIDEAAQLGFMDQVLSAATLMRGYGVRVWTFWQSVAQIDRIYGSAGQELIDNASTISVFGMANGPSARRAAEMTGWEGPLLGLSQDQQVIAQAGCAPRIIGRVNYLKDPRFRGSFDSNPFHMLQPAQCELESAA